MNRLPTFFSRPVVLLHLVVFLWGFIGIWAVLIHLPVGQIVFYRAVLACAFLSLYAWYRGYNLRPVFEKMLLGLLVSGGLVGANWILFFYSIKISTVSVGVICISSMSFFVAILEPIMRNRPHFWGEYLLGMAMIFGISCIVGFEYQYRQGIFLGLISALIASFYTVRNAQLAEQYTALYITFYQMLGAAIVSGTYAIALGAWTMPTAQDVLCLILLASLGTSVAYLLSVYVMQQLSAFYLTLVSNLEPIYAMLLAMLFFGKKEVMNGGFYLGATVILSSVLLYARWTKGRK